MTANVFVLMYYGIMECLSILFSIQAISTQRNQYSTQSVFNIKDIFWRSHDDSSRQTKQTNDFSSETSEKETTEIISTRLLEKWPKKNPISNLRAESWHEKIKNQSAHLEKSEINPESDQKSSKTKTSLDILQFAHHVSSIFTVLPNGVITILRGGAVRFLFKRNATRRWRWWPTGDVHRNPTGRIRRIQ